MKAILRDYLYFSKAQRRGIVILLVGIGIAFGAQYVLKVTYSNQKNLEFTFKELPSNEQKINKSNQSAIGLNKEKGEKEDSYTLFEFDPNHLNKQGWQKLGLSEKQAEAILKYRAKGGKFRMKLDVKKMYTISQEKYDELKSFILLPDTIEFPRKTLMEEKKEDKEEDLIINLNEADSLTLIQLKGIGPVYAHRILQYRKLLGGYYEIAQLKEIWGLPDSTLQKIEEKLIFDSAHLITLNLNTTSVEELAAHPYIDWNLAKAIVNFRKQHGAFQSKEDLRNIYLFNDSLIHKIFPYLAVDK